MKNGFLISLLSGFALMSCSPDNASIPAVVTPVVNTPVASNDNMNALIEQFHGKYKLISSISNQPVDVNLDGNASTNLREEIDELTVNSGTKYNVEVRIYKPTTSTPVPGFLFLQWWPEQYIRTGPAKVWDGGELLSYNPGYDVKYDFQGSGRSFSFSTDLKQITVKPGESENAYRWVRPESVTVLASGRLEVVTRRRLYTRAGVQEVTITSVYERFTIVT